jgi:2-aminoadipate transaminase
LFRYARRTAALKPSAIREILKTTEAPDIISFAGGLPAPELFPVNEIAEAAQAVLADDGPAALQYGVTEGYLPLRRWVSDYLARTVSLNVLAERILITHGSQQGLDLLAKVLVDPGDIVLVENPAYLGALQVFQAYEASVVGIDSDSDGLVPEKLETALKMLPKKPKFLYVIPNFQNPTGVSLSAERRTAVLKIAAAHGIPVVEDDPYGQLRYSGSPSPAFGASASAPTAIYLGTASKIMAPGLRVAWMAVTDAGLYERLVTGKQAADLHTSSFSQRLVHRYVSNADRFSAHTQRLLEVYRRRRDTMLNALTQHLPDGCSWTRPAGGLFLWVTLPSQIDTLELLREASREKVAFVPGAPFWVGGTVRHTLRLNFSNASEERIEQGIRRLGDVIKRHLGSEPVAAT